MADRAAATRVVESLKPGDPAGVDPAAWAAAVDHARVIPAGASVRVVKGSWVGDQDGATVDVITSMPDREDTRSWVFLRKVRGRWLIVGTLPLDVRS